MSATRNNKPSATQRCAKLSLPPYLTRSPPILALTPTPPLLLPLLSPTPFASSSLPPPPPAPLTRLLSASICRPGVFVSLYLRWVRRERGERSLSNKPTALTHSLTQSQRFPSVSHCVSGSLQTGSRRVTNTLGAHGRAHARRPHTGRLSAARHVTGGADGLCFYQRTGTA